MATLYHCPKCGRSLYGELGDNLFRSMLIGCGERSCPMKRQVRANSGRWFKIFAIPCIIVAGLLVAAYSTNTLCIAGRNMDTPECQRSMRHP